MFIQHNVVFFELFFTTFFFLFLIVSLSNIPPRWKKKFEKRFNPTDPVNSYKQMKPSNNTTTLRDTAMVYIQMAALDEKW
jgi:hypothetical protein